MRSRVGRFVGLGLLFGLVFVFFLVATAPASWLAWGIGWGSRGVMNIGAPIGSLWSGEGVLVINQPDNAATNLGRVMWKIEPLYLMLGRLRLNLSLHGSEVQAESMVDISLNTVACHDLRAEFPAKIFTTFYAPIALLALEGRLDIRAESVSMEKHGLHGILLVAWQGASLSLSNVKPLGNYRLYFNGLGETANVEVNTESGSLAITGKGSFVTATRHFKFDGIASPATSAAELEPLLSMIGPDRGNGQRQLKLRVERLY